MAIEIILDLVHSPRLVYDGFEVTNDPLSLQSVIRSRRRT